MVGISERFEFFKHIYNGKPSARRKNFRLIDLLSYVLHRISIIPALQRRAKKKELWIKNRS